MPEDTNTSGSSPRQTRSRTYMAPTHRLRVWINSDGTVGHSDAVKGEPVDHIAAGRAMVLYAEQLHRRMTTAQLWLAAARAGKWEAPG